MADKGVSTDSLAIEKKSTHQGKKFRTITKRTKLNIDQAEDLMNERGYKTVGEKTSLINGEFQTLTTYEKDGVQKQYTPKQVKLFLTTEDEDLPGFK